MKNVTITLDEEVARWARVTAAERNTSVSRMVGEMLRDRMKTERGHELARARFDAVAPRRLRRSGDRLPSRDELHDRAGLR
jgi:hypothetical protein